MFFVVYDVNSRECLSTIDVTSEDLATSYESLSRKTISVTRKVSPSQYYVNLEGQLVNKPKKPDRGHKWEIDRWVDVRPIAELRDQKWQNIKQQRDSTEFSGFTWDGSTFDSDQISQSRIQGAVQLASMSINAEQPFSIEWTLADNSTRVLSAEDMLAVGVALSQHVSLQHSKARLLRAAIEACQTKEALDGISWE